MSSHIKSFIQKRVHCQRLISFCWRYMSARPYMMKLLIFAPISSLKTLTLFQILNNYTFGCKGVLIYIYSLFYKQIDSVAMGSPLGSSLTNAFLSYHEKNWLNNCLQGFKPVFYQPYVDDIFILFKLNNQVSSRIPKILVY